MPAVQAPQRLQPLNPRALPIESTHIIIGSALGGSTFLLFSLLLLLYYTVWRRHHDARTLRHADQCSSTPQPAPNTLTLRAVSPSLRRLGTIPFQSPPSPPPAAAAPNPPVPRSSSARWDIEKGNMTTPTPHPALLWSINNDDGGGGVDGGEGNVTTNTANHRNTDKISSSSEPTAASLLHLLLPTLADPDNTTTTADAAAAAAPTAAFLAPLAAATTTTTTTSADNLRIRPSVSSTFAAELSSLLESISIKSSYSSLRCGGLGAPPPRRTSRTQQQQKKEYPSGEGEKDGKVNVPGAMKGIDQAENTGHIGDAAIQADAESSSGVEQMDEEGSRVEEKNEGPGNVILM